MAVTPAGAEVSNAVATNWKKIWTKNLKPLADKRYYTKAQSDTKYQPKGSYETAGSGYSKSESDAKYAAAGSAYSKAEVDAKFALVVNSVAATAGGDQNVTLTDAAQVVRSVSMMPPSNGIVIASGSGYVALQGSSGGARCSLTTDTAVDYDFLQITNGAANDYLPISGTRGYPVTKGTLLTVNYVCDEVNGDAYMRDSSMTVIFAPS